MMVRPTVKEVPCASLGDEHSLDLLQESGIAVAGGAEPRTAIANRPV